MGGCCSSSDVEPSNEFRKRKNVNADEFDGPVKGRGCTDVPYLVLFVGFLVVWVTLVGYAVNRGDLRRIFSGYDDCGNICGVKNEKIGDSNSPFSKCSGKDMTEHKYMLIHPKSKWDKTKRSCVTDCSAEPNYKKYFQRCIPADENLAYEISLSTNVQEFFQKVAEDVSLCYKEIAYLCIFALALSVFLLLLFRYFAGVLVWFVLICMVVVSVGVSAYLWMLWKMEKSTPAGQIASKTTTYFTYAIISTIVTIVILLLIFAMRKNIHLVAHLFYESGKAVQAMPMIVLQPFITFVAICIILSIWVYFFVWIESSGIPQVKVGSPTERLTFKKDEVIQFARGVNFVAVFWMVQFFIGCQHMVISGAVATWFFTRKKSTLTTPIFKSYSNLIFNHLGTVALGSLLIAIVQVIRVIFSIFKSAVKDPKNDVTRSLYKAFSCCLYCLEKILVFLTRNAYIEVAIFGDNLWTSGKRAYHVLVNNVLRVTAINSVGDFVLFLGKALVVACSVFIGCKLVEQKENLHYMAVPLIVIGVFAYFVSHAFMTAFEMVIDTLFICFCEDCDMNDGQQNPYFMSRGLMEFVEKSQKTLRVGDGASEPKSQTARWLPED